MKILLTGAAGQLGRALRSAMGEYSLVALGRRDLDITDFEQVCRIVSSRSADLVINAAAYTDVDGAEADRENAHRVNRDGPRNLAIATAAQEIPLLHVSTDYVFDGTASRPYHEHDRPNPRSVYGESKLAGERAVAEHNPRHYIVRTAWLYHTDGKNFPRTMLSLSSRDEVRVVSDQRGSPTYAPHLARAIVQLIDSEDFPRAFGIHHMAGQGVTSWYELTRVLYEHLAITTPVVPVTTDEFPRPAECPRFSALTTTHSPKILLPPWEEGIREFAAAARR